MDALESEGLTEQLRAMLAGQTDGIDFDSAERLVTKDFEGPVCLLPLSESANLRLLRRLFQSLSRHLRYTFSMILSSAVRDVRVAWALPWGLR